MSDTLNAYQLARLAGIPSPDGLDTPGARFLESVAATVDDYRRYADDPGQQIDDLVDTAHEIADTCVPIYTHERWKVFVDLAAYQEDPSEIAADVDDMTELAGICLYLIAERLAVTLFEGEGDGDDLD